ncbi:MAG: c-type cytochrome [Chloroflexi bacterium]|nr:c-type cytochrome [Chloroflexota bacterium]
MSDASKALRRPRPKAALAIVAIVLIAFVLLVAYILVDNSRGAATATLSEASYAAEVAVAMEGADADIGAGLINEYECYTCHVLGDGSQSPLFDGIGKYAAERRPPLSAEQYLYEATILPGVFIVEGYSDSMPNNYDERLSEQEVGHIIAYLLTLTEEPANY